MKTIDGEAILSHLRAVHAHRAHLRRDPRLERRVQLIKAFQHQRFAGTYRDLLASPDNGAAARFFLEDLYGPSDFSARDDQFARIVPALVRLFPREIVETVRRLAELHALSEELDGAMAGCLTSESVDTAMYRMAWQSVDRPDERERQVALMLEVGEALISYTRNPLLAQSLRMMRAPARLAHLEALHGFLERGFDTFRSLRQPRQFLQTIATRERKIISWLFSRSPDSSPPDEYVMV